MRLRIAVAFTPKGGCPLKQHLAERRVQYPAHVGSIHPQGWVPVETFCVFVSALSAQSAVAFTPKGGCPLKRGSASDGTPKPWELVAFTPKGGCPLKQTRAGGKERPKQNP